MSFVFITRAFCIINNWRHNNGMDMSSAVINCISPLIFFVQFRWMIQYTVVIWSKNIIICQDVGFRLEMLKSYCDIYSLFGAFCLICIFTTGATLSHPFHFISCQKEPENSLMIDQLIILYFYFHFSVYFQAMCMIFSSRGFFFFYPTPYKFSQEQILNLQSPRQ